MKVEKGMLPNHWAEVVAPPYKADDLDGFEVVPPFPASSENIAVDC